MPQPRTSALAITSLILGLLGCVPFVTSLLAVLFGIAGIGATRKPAVYGKGLAIGGLILGILGLIGWCCASAVVGWAYIEAKPAREVTRQFLADLSTGKVDDAAARCVPTMPRKTLEDQAAQMKTWGALQDTRFFSMSAMKNAGSPTEAVVGGSATFGTTTKSVQFQLVKQGDTFKIREFQIR